MRKKFFSLALYFFISMVTVMSADSAEMSTYIPPNGFVPNEATAIQIAEAVWIPIYGEQQIKGERPYQASLQNGIWVVVGSLPKGMLGGVARAEISKQDGRIVSVSHGR